MNLQFTDRISLFNTIAAAVATGLVFFAVYSVVYLTAYNHLDSDISREADEVQNTVKGTGDSLFITYLPEWEEREHQQFETNPIFLQVADKSGEMVFQSANLHSGLMEVDTLLTQRKFFNSAIGSQSIRIGQFPIHNEEKKITGYLSIGVSRQESVSVLKNLRTTLLVAFPLLLIVLYLATSLAVSQAIAPVERLIREVGGINDANIQRRLDLPKHKDEIYQLAATINELLRRIESGINREKRFTADASHELRSPLAAIRGTLEVLIRKPRDTGQYEEKIGQVIGEVDRMHQILDQLLQLARIESGNVAVSREPIDLKSFLEAIRENLQEPLEEKNMHLHLDIPAGTAISTDGTFLDLILANLLGNAVKYGRTGGNITCRWDMAEAVLTVSDDGPGIPEEHLPRLFDRFYRVDESRASGGAGAGLGLSIVKRLCDLLGIPIEVHSKPDKGTEFLLHF